MKLHEIFNEGFWWKLEDTTTLYHGTSSAFLNDIKTDGLLPPKDEFEKYAEDIANFYLNALNITGELRNEILNEVQERSVKYRTRHGKEYSSVIYFTPRFEQAASYAKSYAEHGGEISYDIWDLVKVYSGLTPPKRFVGNKPIVLTCEIPTNWLITPQPLPALVSRLSDIFNKNYENNNPKDEYKNFDEFVEDSTAFEVRVKNIVTPEMIKNITYVPPKRINEDLISPETYKLQQKYDEFNRKFFNNELPKIPIRFAKLKTVGGEVKYTVVRPAGWVAPNPTLVRIGKVDKYAGASVKNMTMTISSMYMRDEESLDKILLHEMIHTYMVVIGKFNESHGSNFIKVAKDISRKVGFEIPLVDNVSNLVLNDKTTKLVGGILLKKNNGYSVALINPNNLKDSLNNINERWAYFIKNNYLEQVTVFTINSPIWTQIGVKFPIQRKPINKLDFYILNIEGAIEDLQKNGNILLIINKDIK